MKQPPDTITLTFTMTFPLAFLDEPASLATFRANVPDAATRIFDEKVAELRENLPALVAEYMAAGEGEEPEGAPV